MSPQILKATELNLGILDLALAILVKVDMLLDPDRLRRWVWEQQPGVHLPTSQWFWFQQF